jgi:sialidase-1
MKRNPLTVLIVCVLLSFMPQLGARASNPILWERDLFVNGTHGYHTFRIPSLVVTAKGTVLAFAEGRKHGTSDTGDIDLVMRRSTDGGETWGPLVVVWDDGEHVCGNPAPVVDHETGKVWLLLTWNRGDDHERDIIAKRAKDTRRVFVSSSNDDGLNWSTPEDITAVAKRASWGWYATGPGMGVQLTQGPHKGRLVVPANHSYDEPNGTLSGGGFEYGAHSIFSDDHGKTWQLGGVIQPKMNESQLVELYDGEGTLLINMRSYYGKNRRAQSKSRDGGISWSQAVHIEDLIEPVCQGALIRYHGKARGASPILLFSNPASTKREHMEVKASKDHGNTWETWVTLYNGPSAYSALAVLPSGEVLCLYEKGENSPYEQISLVKLGSLTFEKN